MGDIHTATGTSTQLPGVSNAGRHTCPSCGWANTRPSQVQGTIDAVLAALHLTPVRCATCLHRFYRFRSRRARFTVIIAITSLLGVTGYGVNRVAQAHFVTMQQPTPAEMQKSAPAQLEIYPETPRQHPAVNPDPAQ